MSGRNRKMDKEKQLIYRLIDIFRMANMINRYDLFENWVGGYFGYPNTAKKPQFEVIIRIKSKEEQK